MNSVILGLGSNIGDRRMNLIRAIKHLMENDCILTDVSSVYETEPWGNKDQPAFYNMVIAIETILAAENVMSFILEIEHLMGRERKEKWEPRIIDIDILFFNSEVISRENLVVPHPHIHERKFVLVPLNEMIPRYRHPVLKKTVAELLNSLDDVSTITKVGAVQL